VKDKGKASRQDTGPGSAEPLPLFTRGDSPAEPASAKMEGALTIKRFAPRVPVRHTTPHVPLSKPAPNALNFTGERFAPEVTGRHLV
jgi:hypothetical protein